MQNEEFRKETVRIARHSKFIVLHSAFCIQEKGSAEALP
jgi:hypothetical protein